jgi:hypothetical protein
MRTLWAVTILLTVPAVGSSQLIELKVPPRYGININTRTFTQQTPQETLASTIKAIEDARFDVLVAHLIEEKVTEAKAAENARLLENQVEDDLRQLRERQRANPVGVKAEEKLPYEPAAFAEFVKAEAKVRGFRAAIEDVRKKFVADSSIVKEMKRYLRDGTFNVTGDNAAVTLRDVKGKAVYFTKVNGRWFVEDKQDEPAKVEKK